MASVHTKTGRQNQPPSARRQTRGSALHYGKPPIFPDSVKRRTLSKSLTEFFSKLRPSNRPERGGTARPPTDNDGEHSPARPAPPAACRKKRSSSLGPHGPDTIPADRWNTAITPPRRVHSVGSRARRKPVATHSPSPKTASTAPPARNPFPTSHENRIPHQPQSQTNFHPPPNPPQTPRPPSAQSTPLPTTPAHAPSLYLANRAHRHSRRTLLSSGDFLGVTGANPYTGEPDIITPPTSSSSAILSSSSSSWSTGFALAAAAALARSGPDGDGWTGGTSEGDGVGGEAWHRERQKLEKGLRRMAKEEERLCRAEQRKDMVREVLMQGGGVKWKKGEGGWSSVAEPKLSPIMQSPMGSGKSSGSGGHGGSFLEMAAAASGMESCCRRQHVNVGGATRLALAQRKQVGQMRLEPIERQGMGEGLSALGKVMVKFYLPPVVPRRESSQQWDTSRLLGSYPEWELGNLIAIPVDLRRLSEDCRIRRISTGRVVELDDLGPTEPWTEKQLDDLRRPARWTGRMLQESTAGEGRGLTQAHPSVFTPTTTTTGFEHSQPRPRGGGHPFDAMLDGFKEAPLIQRAWTLRAFSRSTLTRSSTRTSSDGCSDQLASPGSMQLSVWRSLNNLGLQIARITTPVWKKVGIGPPQRSRIPLRPHKPEPDSATMSSSTDQETAAHAQMKEPREPVQSMDGAADDRRREKSDWAMRKTMRKLPDPNPSHLKDDEPATRRSSPIYTRTSTSPITQLHFSRTATSSAGRQDEAVTIARGAARTAFRQTTHSRRAPLPMIMTSGEVTVRPVSAPDSNRAHHHGAGAAGMTAKTAAKPASGQSPGQGQGKGKGKEMKETGPGQDDGKGQQEKKEGQDKGKGKEKEKEKEGQQNKEKGKKEALAGSPEFRQWMRNALMMLARVVGAYWQVVSPLFDSDSELRKRLDKAEATRRDGVVCVLAVVFLFLVVSAGVWAVRGIIWLVRLLGDLGEVLRVVAGLQD